MLNFLKQIPQKLEFTSNIETRTKNLYLRVKSYPKFNSVIKNIKNGENLIYFEV